jgi:hypothetical protein
MSITLEQALTATEFHQTGGPSGRPCESAKGPVRWRRNGATKTWKRTPGKFQVPVKYGLRSYDYIRDDDLTGDYVHASEDCPLLTAKCLVTECVLVWGHAPASLDFPHQTINNTNFKAPRKPKEVKA